MVIDVVRGNQLKIIYPMFPDIEDQDQIIQETIPETLISNFIYNEEDILSLSLAKITFFNRSGQELAYFDNLSSSDFLRIGLEMDIPDPVPSGYIPLKEWGLRLILDTYPELPDGESDFLIELIDNEGQVFSSENGILNISEPPE
jgi:hypothetical protein